MIFVDGEEWPPSLHGTGTEDYFGQAWGLRQTVSRPFVGTSIYEKGVFPGEGTFDGRFSLYRFHLLDPIDFQQSIRVTFEHGDSNAVEADYSSVAYWYGPLCAKARRSE